MTESRKTGNIVAERVVLEQEHFALFDQLPVKVREELANAPYPMASGAIVEWMAECRKAGMDDHMIVDLILYRFRAYLRDKVRDECKKLYGPEHPQAGPQ
jgi:hypothetical protein